MMPNRPLLRMLIWTAFFVTLGFAGHASAQRGNEIDSVRIDAHLDANYWAAFGAGMRVDIPIVRDVIDGVGDEMTVSPGIDFLFWHFHYYADHPHDDFVVFPHAVWQWNFYLNEHWSVFPEAGFGIWIGDDAHHHHHHDPNVEHAHVYFDFVAGVGARYHFNDDIALLMRASWPVGLQIGLTFDV
jgi:hypothetical protein